jgi:uncharacterized membrane protein
MSELIVVDYHDPRRAGEVLGALRRLHPEWSADLEDALVFVKQAGGKMRLAGQNASSRETAGEAISADWWKAQRGLTDDFMLQVRRLIRPGDSALFMLIRTSDPDLVIDEVQRYGGRLLQTSLTPSRDALIQADDQTGFAQLLS